MKLKLLLFISLFVANTISSQELSFNIGTNFTQFNLKNPESFTNTPIQTGTGSFIEIGYLLPSKKEKLNYIFGLGINEFNALAGTSANSYRWNTKYLGLRTGFEYDFLDINKLQIVPLFGINFSTIIYGKQETNGVVYDIKSNKEFTGIKLIPYLGLKVKYKINELGYASLSYNHSTTFKPNLSYKEHLTIVTNQIVFGLQFNLTK
jgi:hypothetical protein